MAWSVYDLGQITQLLQKELHTAITNSPRYQANNFDFHVSGLAPEVTRSEARTVLDLYLLHVRRDPFWRNTPVDTSRAQLSASQPLSLDLSYLVTSWADKNWHLEQYLMSIALSYFHANPVYRTSALEFTVTVEADSIEEMSRLWQAITVPIRLSAMFRVAVVFLTPQSPPVGDSRPPVEYALSVGADLNLPSPVPEPEPKLFSLAMQMVYSVAPNATDPSEVVQVQGPPGLAAGDIFRVRGSGLDGPDAAAVFLSPAGGGGSEWPITTWRQPGTLTSPTGTNPNELAVLFAPNYGATPASGTALSNTPMPGKYLLTVGKAGTTIRSKALPISIAPEVRGITSPNTVLPARAGGVYTFTAAGIVTGQTSILLNQTALMIGAAVGPGIATLTAAPTAQNPDNWSISFQLPAAVFPSGAYVQVRLVVNSIEALPGWWVQIP